MVRETPTDTPVWISDHDDIRHLLSDFLDKTEKGTRLLIRLTPKSLPSLFDYNNPESPLIWSLMQLLEKDFGIISIEHERVKAGREIYDNAKVRFNSEYEELVRHWLDRPKQTPYKDQWNKAVDSTEWNISTNIEYIRSNPLTYTNKQATEVAENLRALEVALKAPKTLRSLSANHFWGDSKFLDQKREYLESAFPHHKNKIATRAILVNVYIPEYFSSVLFIENQDTFLMLTTHLLSTDENRIAIVYTAGYRGAATRIRDKGSYFFSFLSQSSVESIDRFTRWWELDSDENLPTFFWGDLDYSGLSILSSLRGVFSGITAWKPGYDLMMQYHKSGISHPIASDNKGSQTDPIETGCQYSDEVLLPAIRENEKFVDQELVDFSDIKVFLIQ